MSYPAWSIKMALFIFRTVSSFIFFIFWTVPSYSVIPITTLMVISKLDIAVYFHITPVGFYIIHRWFTYLIGRKSASKTYPSAFQEIRCSPSWSGQVPPGCRDRGAVKLCQNHCLAKMDSLLTLNSHSNFFGWKMLLSSDIKIPLCVKLANSRPFNLSFQEKGKNIWMCTFARIVVNTLLQYYQMLLCYFYRIQADDIDCVILARTSLLYYK